MPYYLHLCARHGFKGKLCSKGMALSKHPSLKLGHWDASSHRAQLQEDGVMAASGLCFPQYSQWHKLLWSLGTLGNFWRCQQVTRNLSKSSSDKQVLNELGFPKRTLVFNLNSVVLMILLFWFVFFLVGSSSERRSEAKNTCWWFSTTHCFFSSHLPATQQTWLSSTPFSPSAYGTKFTTAWPSLRNELFTHDL